MSIGPAGGTGERTADTVRSALVNLLSPLLADACTERLWSATWQELFVTPTTLDRWRETFGIDVAALAVAGGLTETDLCWHLAAVPPDRAVLEMLADLNCFPHQTPAARPVIATPIGNVA